LIFSISIVPAFLLYITNIAKPIAASAAATVKTNKEIICPVRSPKKYEKETRLILTDRRMISIDINIIITFFLLRKIPITPMLKRSADNIKN
jgi:hypothetical protein